MNLLLKSSIGKKIIMALSAIFLIIFLLQHFLINITSVFNPELFNMLSHFMGTNIVVQFIFQPILIFGVLIHFALGFILEYKNRRSQTYQYNKLSNNNISTWASRNNLLS